MSKKPKIKHGYDHDKDKMKITIRGYSLSKTTRDGILEDLVKTIESRPDRLSKQARNASGKSAGQKVKKLEKIHI